MNKWFILIGLIIAASSCQKKKYTSIEGEWALTYYNGVAWGTNGDSTFNAYPQDNDPDWVFSKDTLWSTSPQQFIRQYEIIDDTIFLNQEAYYHIIEYSKTNLKVTFYDPYFPGREYHFKKI